MEFNLQSDFKPAGDQPQAIETLVNGVEEKHKHQVLLGITGSGKTFAMANVVQKLQRPTLVIAHNKTLAAQLYNEFHALWDRHGKDVCTKVNPSCEVCCLLDVCSFGQRITVGF